MDVAICYRIAGHVKYAAKRVWARPDTYPVSGFCFGKRGQK